MPVSYTHLDVYKRQIFDLSYLEMTLNVDELQVSSLSVGQSVQVTADAVPDKTYTGVCLLYTSRCV